MFPRQPHLDFFSKVVLALVLEFDGSLGVFFSDLHAGARAAEDELLQGFRCAQLGQEGQRQITQPSSGLIQLLPR